MLVDWFFVWPVFASVVSHCNYLINVVILHFKQIQAINAYVIFFYFFFLLLLSRCFVFPRKVLDEVCVEHLKAKWNS